ncbi:MAG: patatin-like phospholipase family protein [Bacilli bacterium]|jgi:NTE family protein|nr:patatin-like phospholipase family protein [Bacilli bacterium]
MLFPKHHLPSVGLVLDGGGARGPYQIGVYMAMEKYGLTEHIIGTSGSSIGAFMSVLFLYKDPEKMISFWQKADNATVKKGKEHKLSALASVLFKKEGYYSREGLVDLVNANINLAELVNSSSYPLYVSLAKEIKDAKGKVVSYLPEYLSLKGKSSEDIMTLLLATSAIPLVFDPVSYKQETYVDPMKADNEPYKPLLHLDPDMLFILPLNDSHLNKSYPKDFLYPIVDFSSPRLFSLPKLNMIDFKKENADIYISEGYQVGKLLLHSIYVKGELHALSKKQKKERYKPYYSLSKLGIDNIEFATMDVKEILNDIKKGAE